MSDLAWSMIDFPSMAIAENHEDEPSTPDRSAVEALIDYPVI